MLLHQTDYTVGRYISLGRLIEESKETFYESLRLSSKGWHEGKHSLKPWWEYSLGILIGAYQEFERRVGTLNKTRGPKTLIVEDTIKNLPATFSITDIERLCPSVSREMIRVVLNRLRKEGLPAKVPAGARFGGNVVIMPVNVVMNVVITKRSLRREGFALSSK